MRLCLADYPPIEVSGSIVRTARLLNEGYDFVSDPKLLVEKLKIDRHRADLFTFTGQVPDKSPRFEYHHRDESIAVLKVSTYEKWWKEQINDKTRNMIRKSEKKGVTVRVVDFDDQLLEGIKTIYDEHPLRQGRRFKHFGKGLSELRATHETYLDQSEFIGAYAESRLVGFVKLVHQAGWSSMMQIISLISERGRAPTNALIAKTVEICANKGIPLLQYGTWSRRGAGDFKRHHGFLPWQVTRYYVPLTALGRLSMSIGLHRPLVERIPDSLLDQLADLRGQVNSLRYRR
jgi:hypothetical protein